MSEGKQAFYFYQVSTVVLNRYGGEAASVHAVIWNSSKNDYVCELGESKIGNITHMSYKKVGKYIKLLEKEGYIKFKGWSDRYRTKTYKYVPEMIEFELQEEDMVTLACNDSRKNGHKVDNEISKSSTCDKLGHVTDSYNTCDIVGDKVGHIRESYISNNPPIKNFLELQELVNNYDFLSFSLEQLKEIIVRFTLLAEELGIMDDLYDVFEKKLPEDFVGYMDCNDIQQLRDIAITCLEYIKTRTDLDSTTKVKETVEVEEEICDKHLIILEDNESPQYEVGVSPIDHDLELNKKKIETGEFDYSILEFSSGDDFTGDLRNFLDKYSPENADLSAFLNARNEWRKRNEGLAG